MTELREKLIAATIDLDSGPAHTVDDFLQAIHDAGYVIRPLNPSTDDLEHMDVSACKVSDKFSIIDKDVRFWILGNAHKLGWQDNDKAMLEAAKEANDDRAQTNAPSDQSL